MDAIKHVEVEAAELSRGVNAWRDDPYGRGETLRGKRSGRGWSVEQEQRFRAEISNTGGQNGTWDIMSFLEWLKDEQSHSETYTAPLPWS